jgi:hypothetical protein
MFNNQLIAVTGLDTFPITGRLLIFIVATIVPIIIFVIVVVVVFIIITAAIMKAFQWTTTTALTARKRQRPMHFMLMPIQTAGYLKTTRMNTLLSDRKD